MIIYKRFKTIFLTFIFLGMLLTCGIAKSQEDNLLDPLNLNKPDKKEPPRIIMPRLNSIITAISVDKDSKTITITATPYLKATCVLNNNNVEIEIPNSYLHKRLSDKSYNWNYKLTSQFPMLARASVNENSKHTTVILDLKFVGNVKLNQVKRTQGKICYTFQELTDTTPKSYKKMNIDPFAKTDIKANNINISSKPSGTYNTIVPSKPINNTNNHIVNNTIPPISNPSPITSKPLPNNHQPISTPKQPVKNNTPEKNNCILPEILDLPPLDKPEETQNNLLNANDYDDLIKIATSLEAENNLEGAIQKFSQAIQINSSRYEGYSALGDIYFKQERFDLAIENYEKSISINPNQVKTLHNLSTTYTKKQDYSNAISTYQKILAIQPGSFEANNAIAYAYFNQNDFTNAIKYYQESLKLLKPTKNNTELAKTHYNLANTYKAQKNYELSIKEYKEAIKLSPDFSDVHYNMGATYVDMQKYPKAIAEFEAYIKASRDQSEIDRVKKIIEHLKKVN